MNKQNELFDLIKSMNKSEKRYFKLNSQLQKGNKIYSALFDSLDKLKTYNEKQFKLNHKYDRFIKHFAFNKNHLFRLIIKSLVNYNSGASVDSKIHSLISECKILFRKAIYQKYFRTLSKAKQLASRYERYGYLIQIIDMEKMILRKEELQYEKIVNIYNELDDALIKTGNAFAYTKLAALLLNNYRVYGLNRAEINKSIVDNITATEIMVNSRNAISIRAKDSFYRVKEISASINADYKKEYLYLTKRLEIIKKNPEPFEDYIIHYPSDILYSLVEISLKLSKFGESEKYLKQIENQLLKNSSAFDDYEIYCTFTKFRIRLKKGEYINAALLIPLLEEILIKYKNKMLIDTELSIMYNIIKAHLLNNNYQNALHSANKLLNHPLINKRKDYESYIRIIYLIIHFELKNFELLKHLLISTYRYLYKREKLFRTEQLIIEFIRKLPKVESDDDLKFLFIKFRKELIKLKKDSFETNAFEYFDFLSWIDTKL